MKKVAVLVVAVFVLAMALPAFAASQENSKLADLFNQLFAIRKQIVDEYVQQGQLTDQQGDYIKQRIDFMQKYRQEVGDSYGPGYGMMGPGGYGMMGGPGFCGGMGGWGPYGAYGPQNTSNSL